MPNEKKRKYYRKCGVCGERHEQSDMIRTEQSPNGWICFDCFNMVHPEYEDFGGGMTMPNEMRERLIELIKQANNELKQYDKCEACSKGEDCMNHYIADYLLANGVIVPQPRRIL